MAKIKWGLFVVDGRGKSNGHVLSKNRGGNYIRTKVTPSNPRTTFQMGIRGIFASISSAWSGLTESNRLSWNGAVNLFTSTDIFGDIRTPSGKALFQKLNQNLLNVGLPLLTSAPEPTTVPFADVTGATGDASASTLFIASDGDTTGSKLIVFATAPLSQGTSFVKNKLRAIAVIDGDAGAPLSVGTEYIARFGALTEGANIYVGVKVINAVGQASPLETVKVVVAA